MATVTVIMNRAAVDRFKGWHGPVGISVHRLARMIANTQRAKAPVRTGHLLASIRVGREGHWARGIAVNVGSNPPPPGRRGTRFGYSYMTNEGTRPHRITARRAARLRFFWVKVGHVVHFHSVNHPGQRVGMHWADRGMAVAMRAWNA